MNKSAEERIESFFIDLTSEISIKDGNYYIIPAIFTQTEIAEYIGVSREYINIIFKTLSGKYILRKERNNWVYKI